MDRLLVSGLVLISLGSLFNYLAYFSGKINCQDLYGKPCVQKWVVEDGR